MLFLGVHNRCRSQMAEAFANRYGGEQVIAESGGIEGSQIHPRTIEALQEEGIDISRSLAKEVSMKALTHSKLVVIMCEKTKEKCPIVPFGTRSVQWDVRDPILSGSESASIEDVRKTRDEIKRKVLELLQSLDIQIAE